MSDYRPEETRTPDAPSGQPDRPAEEKKPGRPAWIVGAVFILVGLVFILQNVSGFRLDNWWALFILIPAAGSLGTAWQFYRKSDYRLTAASRGPLIGGLILLGVTATFLFGLDWGKVWPAFIILVGLSILLTSFERKR